MTRLSYWLMVVALAIGMAAFSLDPSHAAAGETGEVEVANGGKQDPVFDPDDFADESGDPFPVDNEYLPMVPGTTFVYEGETEDGLEHNEVYVTHETKEILGVTCTVVRDKVWVEGELAEDTLDWFAQDEDGNIWYFGEYSEEYENGEVVSTEGSWEAGVDGAEPGILMPANPRPGDSYQQEYYEDVAEDMAKVLRLNASASVPYGDFEDCLKTKEWTPLELGTVEHKYYASGVGLVLVVELKGGHVRIELIDILAD